MKIEKVATGNGEEVGGEKQTIKRTNSRKKKMANQISQSTWKKKSIENQASWKKTTNCDAEWLRHLSLLILKK